MIQANKLSLSYENNFASTSATSATYTQIFAASACPTYQISKIQYYNSSTQPIKLATGASGSEQDCVTLPPTTVPVVIEVLVPMQNRISINPKLGNATSGILVIDFFIP